MPRKTVAEFRAEREAQNTLLLESKHKHIQRFFNIDNGVYEDGALPAKTKEMLGLAASLVLRCDDCITYHMITIPHLRRAAATRVELRDAAT